jgi:hypothetical protein
VSRFTARPRAMQFSRAKGDGTVVTAEKLAEKITANYDNPLHSAIDVPEHHYPDPDGFVADTPMGRYTGVTEMVEMSKRPGEYKYPLTPFGSWQPSWL